VQYIKNFVSVIDIELTAKINVNQSIVVKYVTF
jgi:hypothetical protein